jgi:predicted amidohydrolase YtcJ
LSADLLLTGGSVYTLDPTVPRAEAIALVGDRVQAIGSSTELLALKGRSTLVINLRGRTVVPGFYDAHQHQALIGLGHSQVNARVASIDELIIRVATRAREQPAGTWIEAAGYDDGVLAERRHPNRNDLDSAAPENPVVVTRTCGHVAVLNSHALAAAGIGSSTPDPIGGRIDRDIATNQPTGVIRERAMERLRRVIPKPTKAMITSAILEAAAANLRAGVTSVWEPGIEPTQFEAYRDLEADGRLPIRVALAHMRILGDGSQVRLPKYHRGARLSTAGVKLVLDGALAPRTAALSEPYVGEATNRGLLTMDQDELNQHVLEIHRAGLQASIHAIGDAAIDSALVALTRAVEAHPRGAVRHRIEHCGLPLPALHSRLAAIGVVAVIQPPFLHFHGDLYVRNLGQERSRWLYPAKTLLGLCMVAGSSDGPVVPDCSPLFGIRVAMTRRSSSQQVIGGEEALSFEAALRLYTTGAATAAAEELQKGSLSPGKLADLVVLGADPAQVRPEEVDQVPIEMVVLGGQIVWRT